MKTRMNSFEQKLLNEIHFRQSMNFERMIHGWKLRKNIHLDESKRKKVGKYVYSKGNAGKTIIVNMS